VSSARRLFALASIVALAAPATAVAYVGPGLGVGAVAAFFGAVLAVLLAIVGVVWYPLKRLFGRRKGRDGGGDEPGSGP
jgi:hypothetical protein